LEYNIKIDVKETGWQTMESMHSCQDMDKWGVVEMRGIYLLSVEEIVSQLGICSLELIGWFVG
jgi:hypothetical protein